MHTLGHYLYKARKAVAALFVSTFLPYRRSRISDKEWESEYRTGHWDYLRTLEQAARYRAIAGYAEHFTPGGAILDVGCGDGYLQEILAPAGYRRYLGLDLSAEAVRRAAVRADERTDFVQCEVDRYAPEERFDAIVFNEVLYYLDAPLEVLARYAAHLAEGGKLIVSIHGARPWNRRLWKMIAAHYAALDEVEISHGSGKFWTIKVLEPKEKRDGS